MDAVLSPAGADAIVISEMAWVLVAGGALIFGGVMLLLGLSLRRRAAAGFRPAVWIVGGGLLLPVSVLSALMAYNVWRSTRLDPRASHGALVVSVTAKMWWWEVRYRGPSGDVVLANELHLPVGRPVYLALTSSDVIHSFWVPALAGKMDMVPGRMTGLRVTAAKEGVYRGQCAEYCGIQHARMALHVVAHAQEGFDAWLARQARPAEPMPPAGAQALHRGRSAFAAHCAACHTVREGAGTSVPAHGSAGRADPPGSMVFGAGIPDAGITGRLGPDLTHVGSRMYLGAGTLRNAPGAMAAWIADPHAHKSGVRMPSASGVDADTLQALSAYLEHLQ